MSRRVLVLPDADAVARVAASALLLTLIEEQADHSPLHVAVTGGTVGVAMLAAAAADPLADLVDWAGVHLWWSDERFLPDRDAERNETQARTALIDHLGDRLPPAQVHAVPAADQVPDAETAAARYGAELAALAPAGASVPAFDVLVLGVGPDGHVASLFPQHPVVLAQQDATVPTVVAVHDSPKPPPDRVSFSFATIDAARRVWLVAAGAGKADRIAAALAGSDRTEVPAAGVHGQQETRWFLDASAASATR